MQHNPKDPLIKAGPGGQRELFERFTREAGAGFSTADVIGAAFNVIVNAIRQAHESRDAAVKSYDELFGKNKSLLLNHYDSRGRLRGVFPYPQIIEATHFNTRGAPKVTTQSTVTLD